MKTPFPQYDQLADLIRLAKVEDMRDDDVTSRLLIPADAHGRGVLVQKQAGVICGLPIVEMVCRQYDPRLKVAAATGNAIDAVEGHKAFELFAELLRLENAVSRHAGYGAGELTYAC